MSPYAFHAKIQLPLLRVAIWLFLTQASYASPMEGSWMAVGVPAAGFVDGRTLVDGNLAQRAPHVAQAPMSHFSPTGQMMPSLDPAPYESGYPGIYSNQQHTNFQQFQEVPDSYVAQVKLPRPVHWQSTAMTPYFDNPDAAEKWSKLAQTFGSDVQIHATYSLPTSNPALSGYHHMPSIPPYAPMQPALHLAPPNYHSDGISNAELTVNQHQRSVSKRVAESICLWYDELIYL